MISDVIKKSSVFLTTLFLLLIIMPATVFCGGSVVVLDNDQIQQSTLEGIKIDQEGQYNVWAWTLDAASLTIEIDGKVLDKSPDPKAIDGVYSWKRFGRCELGANQFVSIQIYSNTETKALAHNSVGWLAFADDAEWRPDNYFDLCKVFPDAVHESDDDRLGILLSNKHFYAFPHFNTQREWLKHKRELRDHFLVSMGCFPTPPRTQLNAKVFDKIKRDDYSIEKVYFESLPGFFVTGNLYRPVGKQGPFPAILCPHGHWAEGRLTDTDNNSIPGRCINFAKQGYIALAIDMIGYVDSKQLSHKFGGRAEWLWGLSLHGLHFWNSVRSIDFLEQLEDVDKDRIGCTGASGGGTQTYGLMAVDERIKVAAPVNMLSAHFQGGCLCENAPNMRIHSGNLELGAMMAPRPLMMVSCTGDWTNETFRVEYPAVKSIYDLFEKPDHVGVIQIDANHNYNRLSREAVYAWFGKWFLNNDNSTDFLEQKFSMEPDNKVRVFPGDLPDNAISEKELVTDWKEMAQKQLQDIHPTDNRKIRRLRRDGDLALRHCLGVINPDMNDLVIKRIAADKQGELFVEKMLLGRKGVGDEIPAILISPLHGSSDGTLLVNQDRKEGWFNASTGKPGEQVQTLLNHGHAVLLIDPFMTGEFNSPFGKAKRDVDISHFLTYNQSETALRVQDIITSITFLKSRFEIKKINLIGSGAAGLWCLLAAAMTNDLQSIVIDADQFDSNDDAQYLEKLFVPGLRRAGDIRTAQALLAPSRLLMHNTNGVFETDWAETAYKTVEALDRLKIDNEKVSAGDITAWINQ